MANLRFSDGKAVELWGNDVYDAIPKSVFAVAAWHLANLSSEDPDGEGQAQERFCEEVTTIAENGIIEPAQAKRVLAAFKRK